MSSTPDPIDHSTPLVQATETFEHFYRRSYRPLVGLAIVLTGRPDDGEDLAQEALAAAYRQWPRIAGLDAPDAWVRRVVANRSVSAYRRSLTEFKALTRLVKPGRVNPSAAGVAESVAFWQAVRRILPRRQFQAAALRYGGDLTLAEIAAVMECSPSTANTHLKRAHQRLADELGEEWTEDW